jgi:hypothetical protein
VSRRTGFAASAAALLLTMFVTSPTLAAVPPTNDDFANAITVSGSTGSQGGTTVDATAESGEPVFLQGASAPAASVWYSWVATATHCFVFQTPADFDTVLGVYTGSAVNALTTIATNDDGGLSPGGQGSRLGFNATSGTTYRIGVGAFHSTQTGNFTLEWTDSCSSPTVALSTSVRRAVVVRDSSVTVNFTVGDLDDALNTLVVACNLDGGGSVSCGSPFTVSGLSSGLHDLTIQATEPSGLSSDPLHVPFTIKSKKHG